MAVIGLAIALIGQVACDAECRADMDAQAEAVSALRTSLYEECEATRSHRVTIAFHNGEDMRQVLRALPDCEMDPTATGPSH